MIKHAWRLRQPEPSVDLRAQEKRRAAEKSARRARNKETAARAPLTAVQRLLQEATRNTDESEV